MWDLDIDLNLLPVVLAVTEERSVSRAAQRLGWTQPKVSIALNKLRASLGDPLFIRTSHGMEPTPRALSLIAPTKDILQRVKSNVLLNEAFDPAATTRKFTFALSDIGEMTFLPKLLAYFEKHAPNASVSSVTLPPNEIANGLESGDVDLACGYFPDLKKRNFFQQRLFPHSFICLLNADHPIKGEQLSMKDFLRLGHAVVRAEGRSQEIFEQLLQKHKIERHVVLSTPHFMSIPFIIASTNLLVTVPYAVGESFARIANIRLIKPPMEIPYFDLKQHWHRKYHKDEANMWVRAVVSKLFGNPQ
ncbi:LysR family transcriptional regulator [Noviherbaspirillum cavernae]|uniref:LysR family transcriptional regulator n=1 Tax=Noviherbaspirillum cavernae TaxID=2320862 RepID=A0A418X3E8_9BURK|nr:LysR family transcriptional regulator [Noviherbaspirillum cavernae]RJG06987.1 LysR family transcriptional regulator [Noviherbaspirillum cavernae]